MKVPGRQLFQSWVDIGEREPGVAGAALWQPQAMVEIPFGDCAGRPVRNWSRECLVDSSLVVNDEHHD